MRVLVVTGRLAEENVRRLVSDIGMDVDVHVLPVSVAAFITPEQVVEDLKGLSVDSYDVILLPGTVRGDVSPVEEALNVPTYKGPSDASDLPYVLEHLREIELSKTESATGLIVEAKRERALREIEDVERNWKAVLEAEGGFLIGHADRSVAVGSGFPMRVIAEIVNAPTLKLSDVTRRARYYEAEGADIIDIGMLAADPRPETVVGVVEAVKSAVRLPVSIDTLDPDEIKAAADAGVDLVLSVDRGNIEEVAPHVRDVPVVVLPSNMSEGFLPGTAEERFIALVETMNLAIDMGVEKVIADPVLEPAVNPGLLESLRAYQLFRSANEDVPVLFGLGNATELIDADSTGVNGLLTALACEVGADLLFVPEFSSKARGSVREVVTASRMMFLASRRGTPPKDLGVDLLRLKEKRWKEKPYDRAVEEVAEVLEARGDDEFTLDEEGWFVIRVDRETGQVVATHYKGTDEPDLVVKGVTAQEIYQTIFRRGLVGRFDHAAYLGKELAKAELALILGRSYVQDDSLF